MTIISRSNDHLTVERQLVSYTVTRDNGTTDSAGYVLESDESLARLRDYSWTSDIKVRTERVTFKVGDQVEVRAFGRTRTATVAGIGRTKLQLIVVKNAQGGLHTGSYAAELVTNLTTPATVVAEVADDAPATELEGPAETVELVDLAAAVVPTDAPAELPTRLVRLVGPDSTDSCDLYVERQLTIAALTRPERAALLAALQAADAPARFPYDVQELRGLDLPHAMAMVHNAQVHHLALWHDGAPMAEWELDPRLTADEVRERAEELAAEVSRRVREGLL